MKLLIVLCAVFLGAVSTNAQNLGVVGGLNFANVEGDAGGGVKIEYDADLGFQVGIRMLVAQPNFTLRTGAEVRKYNISYENANFGIDSLEASGTQLHVPLTMLKMISPQIGIFGGGAMALHLSDDFEVNGADVDSEFNSLFFMAEFGVAMKLSEVASAEFFYDIGLTEVAEDTDASVYGFQLVYHIQ